MNLINTRIFWELKGLILTKGFLFYYKLKLFWNAYILTCAIFSYFWNAQFMFCSLDVMSNKNLDKGKYWNIFIEPAAVLSFNKNEYFFFDFLLKNTRQPIAL